MRVPISTISSITTVCIHYTTDSHTRTRTRTHAHTRTLLRIIYGVYPPQPPHTFTPTNTHSHTLIGRQCRIYLKTRAIARIFRAPIFSHFFPIYIYKYIYIYIYINICIRRTRGVIIAWYSDARSVCV